LAVGLAIFCAFTLLKVGALNTLNKTKEDGKNRGRKRRRNC
jgi:hypothetical protein